MVKSSRTIQVALVWTMAMIAAAPPFATAEPITGEQSLSLPAETGKKSDAAEALALFNAHDYAGSLALWEKAVQQNPSLPPAQAIMADLYFRSGMFDAARKALQNAIADSPDDPEAYLLLGEFALSDRKPADAELQFLKAESLLAKFDGSANRKTQMQSRMLIGRIGAAESRKDWQAGIQLIETLMQLDPKNQAAKRHKARFLFHQGKTSEVLETLKKAAAADPNALPAEITLGQFYADAGDQKNAQTWMNMGLKASPKNMKARLAVGQWAMTTGRLDEAQKHAIAATQLAPQSTEAKLFRGTTALFQKDFAAAESIFDAVVKQSPQNVVATNNLALALIAQQDATKSQRALEYAEANAKRFPQSPEIASTYGLVLYRLGKLQEAENTLRIAAQLAESDVDTAYIVASLAIDRGRKEEAKALLEKALKSPKPFMFRQEAEELLEGLKK